MEVQYCGPAPAKDYNYIIMTSLFAHLLFLFFSSFLLFSSFLSLTYILYFHPSRQYKLWILLSSRGAILRRIPVWPSLEALFLSIPPSWLYSSICDKAPSQAYLRRISVLFVAWLWLPAFQFSFWSCFSLSGSFDITSGASCFFLKNTDSSHLTVETWSQLFHKWRQL